MRKFYRFLRVLSSITLFFFCWTFLPLYSAVAFAVEKPPVRKGDPSQSPLGNDTTPLKSPLGREGNRGVGVTSSERFEKALEDIREKVGKAEVKAGRGEDDKAERDAIKSRRAEIESLDADLKKEFSATEKKLKDAKLPKEILDRHYKFVKHYEDNLKELKTNLAAIENPSATSQELRAALSKAKQHLERTKTPSKHVPLDPNKLPHRMVKGKERAPRLKKEEFEKDFPRQKKPAGLRNAEFGVRNVVAAEPVLDLIGDFSLREKVQQKRILLAYNSTIASDMPLELPRPLGESVGSVPEWLNRGMRGSLDTQYWGNSLPDFAYSDLTPHSALATPNFMVAQATVALPTADDLAETPEVQFTPEILAKAAELGHNPVKIYEWVRNNIEFVPTYGSIQGAQMTMETKLGNAFDTASLLIALYRASGIPARYVYGTVEMPIEKVMNWVGGVTDPKMAGTVLATNGIPAKMLISGGTYKAVQLEHVYVSAFIDYIPSRGAVHKQGDTWIPLDPSFKQYTYTQGIDIKAAVPFDAQAFTDQLVSTATISETGGYVTNVNSTLVQQTMQDYQTQVQNYIQQNHPNATVGDVIGKKEILKQEFGILLGTLPYMMIQAGSEFATVPDNLRATMSFSIPDPIGVSAGLTYTTSLPEIAGKKITLSFAPPTATDQAVLESYLPRPHSDGTPIQPNELPTSFPAYMINLTSELRIDGQLVATGSSVMMGKAQPLTMSLNEPGIGVSNIDNVIQAGEYYGIGVDTGKMGNLEAHKGKLQATKTKLETQNFSEITKDDLVGDLLYATIAIYFAELDYADEISATTIDVIRYRVPSVGMFSFSLSISELFGIPRTASGRGLMMDVDRIMQSVFSKDGNMPKVRNYMLSSGIKSSMLEHAVPERLYSMPNNSVQAISAVKAIKLANEQGIPIYTITPSNIGEVLPHLQVNISVKDDIVNAVNSGKIVITSKTNIAFNASNICGYIILDPSTGAGAYLIGAGFNGALVILAVSTIAIMFALLAALSLGGAITIFGALVIGFGTVIEGVIASAILILTKLFFIYYLTDDSFFGWVQDQGGNITQLFSELMQQITGPGHPLSFLIELLSQLLD